MQLDFFDVPSPCINVCESDEKGNCRGCMRTRDERQEWKNLTNDGKQKVIKRCIQRQKRKEKSQKVKDIKTSTEEDLDKLIQPSLLDPPSKVKPSKHSDLDFSEFEL